MKPMTPAISRDPEIMHGAPVFRGTRVPVQTMFEYLEGGETLEEFFNRFSTVSREFAVRVGGSEAPPACERLMRLLIDECIDERLRHFFPGHGRQTAH
jgi:hypothetical protein